jgi:hypothetical protein
MSLKWTRKPPQVVAENQAPYDFYAVGMARHYMLARESVGGYLDTCDLTGRCTGLHAYGPLATLKREAALWDTMTVEQVHARQANGIRNMTHRDYAKEKRS